MLNKNKILKSNPIQYTTEMIFANLEAIIRQMLLVWAKESIALNKISGKKCGNYIEMHVKTDAKSKLK